MSPPIPVPVHSTGVPPGQVIRGLHYLTAVDWPKMKRGNPGIGGTHHVAFATAGRETLPRWKWWLTDHGQPVEGPYDRTSFTSISTADPDRLIVGITTNGPAGMSNRAGASVAPW